MQVHRGRDSDVVGGGGGGPTRERVLHARSPLAAGETRLNLFEPRWLSLMDRLAAENGAAGGRHAGVHAGREQAVRQRGLARATGNGDGRGVDSSGERTPVASGVSGVAGRRSADIVIERGCDSPG